MTCLLALVRPGSAGEQSNAPLDIVPFGRVVTWDPNRYDGCRASRIQEFCADDVFPETDLSRGADGFWRVPVSTNGLGCIGIQWLNRRAIKEASIEFRESLAPTVLPALRAEGWFGESAWQGEWKRLTGELRREANRLVFQTAPTPEPLQTCKLRWILPAGAPRSVASLSAFTYSMWQTASLRIETEGPAKQARGSLGIINGEFINPRTAPAGIHNSSGLGQRWDFSKPGRVTIRYSQPDSLKSDPTVLLFSLPGGQFGVAVEDVLSNACVYLPESGVYVCSDLGMSLTDYKRSIAGRKTVLQQVRQMPDQTLEQAMTRTHHRAQSEGPVLLSLACDNRKFVLERDGRLRFPATTNGTADWLSTACELQAQFGRGGEFTRALEGGWLPAPLISVATTGLVYQQRTFVAPEDEHGDPKQTNRLPVCVVAFTITNTDSVGRSALLAVRVTQNRKPLKLPSAAGEVVSIGERGLNAMLRLGTDGTLSLIGADGTITLGGEIPAHGSSRLAVYLADAHHDLKSLPGPERLRQNFESYWRAVLAPAIQIETPELFLNDLIRSSQVRCLIAARNEPEQGRVAPWIAAMAYGPLESEAHSVIRGMDFMGQGEFARQALDYFIHRYNENGFLTTGYTTFGTAWHLWTLGEHYQLTGDLEWLRDVAPELKRVGDWIVRQTEKTTQPGAPESGLMPPGVMADWNAFAYHFTLNGYYYAALSQLADLLEDLHDPRADFFRSRAAGLRANILRAYHWTAGRSPALPLRNGTWISAYPSQVHSPGKLADFFPGQDAGRSWCYDVELGAHQLVPSGVMAPAGADVSRMLNHMEDVQFLADGWFDYPASLSHQDWFNLGGFSKVQPYYTRNCEVYALCDDIKPFIRSYFNTMAAMVNPEVLTFWEHFNHSGAWDKTHETGYFLHQTRTMLVTERGNELWLAPFVTTNWLTAGKTLSVSNAPTRFGPVSFRIDSRLDQRRILAYVVPPVRSAPATIVLRLCHPQHQPIYSVRVNGRRHEAFSRTEETIRLKPSRSPLDLEVVY